MTGCQHDNLSRLVCEPEGYENPTEPLQVRVTCLECECFVNVVLQDVPFQAWEPIL